MQMNCSNILRPFGLGQGVRTVMEGWSKKKEGAKDVCVKTETQKGGEGHWETHELAHYVATSTETTDRGRRTGFRKYIEESGQMWPDADSRAGMC